MKINFNNKDVYEMIARGTFSMLDTARLKRFIRRNDLHKGRYKCVESEDVVSLLLDDKYPSLVNEFITWINDSAILVQHMNVVLDKDSILVDVSNSVHQIMQIMTWERLNETNDEMLQHFQYAMLCIMKFNARNIRYENNRRFDVTMIKIDQPLR